MDLKLSQRFGLYNSAAPGLAASNGIRLRAYLDDPAFGTTKFFDQFLIPSLPSTPTFPMSAMASPRFPSGR